MGKRVNYSERVEDGELDLSMSDLSEVPVRDIALAKKATSLDLSSNRLTSLGKNFTVLTHLVKLDLSKNSIAALPSNFGDLVLLKHLDLYSNKLNHLPLSFGKLKNLKWLDLKNNPLVPALQEIAGPCLDSQQCQNCAKRVVSVLSETIQRVDEEKRKQEQEEKEREMAEKSAAKKEQQKNKKPKNEPKKKVAENGVKEQPQKQQQKKKDKAKQKAQSKSGGSFLGNLIRKVFLLGLLVSIALGVLYVVDPEKARNVTQQAKTAGNAAVSLLPPQTFVLLNQTSTFLNTDPRVKVYWAGAKDVAGVVYDRLAVILAKLAADLPVYYNLAKNQVLNALNATETKTR